MADRTEELVQRVIVVVDLSRYRNIAKDLDQQVDCKGVALLNRQIQDMIDSALNTVGIVPQAIPSKFTGDGKILSFETAEHACHFAENLHRVADRRNQGRNGPLHQRHFRIGICSGKIVLERTASPDGGLIVHDFAGIAVSDATRLEGACKTGEILICPETWAHLPPELKRTFGNEEKVEVKHSDELFLAHRCKVVDPAPASEPPKGPEVAPRDKVVDRPPAPESPPESDLVRDILSKLLSTDSIPRADGDINEAIARAIRDVDGVVKNAVTGKGHLTLKDIGDIVGEAIHHGAGIYNVGSHLGCASIYLHAARRVLEHLPDASPGAHGPLPKGTYLAAEWLARIVLDNPTVDEPTADDLAWELRFAFDSIRQIPLLDQINMAIAMARTGTRKPDVDEICKIVEKVTDVSQGVMENHVRAYLLRHTALAILATIDHCYGSTPPSQGRLSDWHRLLRPVVDANPHVTRYVAQHLALELAEILRAPPRGNHGRWYDPRAWFGAN
ncbi:MAG: hypothetical protein QOE70_4433 [Chthoniobacter sp.]|jgi:class 3 adenylate cyclase|nr:hypothetical protein [Chthoniobacter sp.]